MANELLFPVKKLVNLTEEQAKLINDFRYNQRLPSDNEAIRRLIERGLAIESAGELAPVSKPAAALPGPDMAANYAPPSTYAPVPAPTGGYPWESVSPDKTVQLNTTAPARLKLKLQWLVDQLKAAGFRVTQEKLLNDALGEFARRELKAWGVPRDRA